MEFKPSDFLMKVRASRPLVHHITNYVTVNDCANICICAGGSPVMTDGPDTADMVAIASSTVLNIGTLNPCTVDSMAVAADAAKGRIPIVLDPVGAGATPYRTEVAGMLMSKHPEVIKGNAGEIGILSGLGGEVRGVDSDGSSDTANAVRKLALSEGCVVAASGPVDYVSDGKTTVELSNGSSMMEKVSGTGCMLSSVIGCYVGACGPSVWSVAAAITALNVASEKASRRCSGPGTFKIALMDAMDSLTSEEVDSAVRMAII